MSTSTLLGEIVCLHQHTKNPLKYVYTNSNYGHLVAMTASVTHESFSRATIYKGWVDKILLHLSVGKEENKMAMAQNLLKYLFDKYEDEAFFSASQCGLPISNSMKPEYIYSIVDDYNITLTGLRIICNYMRDAFGMQYILPEEAVHNLRTEYMESEYGKYDYEK